MHAVFMTFEFSGGSGELTNMFGGFADALSEARGLVTHTWMRDGSTIGGFHVFHTVQAAEQFLKSGRVRALAAHPRVSDFYVRLFSTLTSTGATLAESAMVMHVADGADGDATPVWQGDVIPTVTHVS
jgi:hypothetical protein